MQIVASKGLKVSPGTVDEVDMVNVKHSSPGSSVLSAVMDIGTH